MMPDPIEGRGRLSVVRNTMKAEPKPKVHGDDSLMLKENMSTGVMNRSKVR